MVGFYDREGLKSWLPVEESFGLFVVVGTAGGVARQVDDVYACVVVVQGGFEGAGEVARRCTAVRAFRRSGVRAVRHRFRGLPLFVGDGEEEAEDEDGDSVGAMEVVADLLAEEFCESVDHPRIGGCVFGIRGAAADIEVAVVDG